MIYRLFLVLALLLATSPAHAGYFGPAVASVTTYAPNPPTISAAVASSTSVTISKTADGTVDGLHSAATGYDLYRTAANGAADSETLWQADVTFPYTDTGLTTGATYRYKVKSKNTAGASATYSNEVSATPTASPTAPGAPTGVTATAGNAQATVTFTAPAANGGSAITGYTVTSSPAGGTDSNAGSTSLSHVVTGLTNGTAYTFTVTATNTAGTSSPSSASNSVTPSASGTFNDDFVASGTFDSANLTALFSGTATYGSTTDGIAGTAAGITVKTTTSSDRAMVIMTQPIDLTVSRTYRFRVKVASGVAWVGLYHFGAAPSITTTPWTTGEPILISTYNTGGATQFAARLSGGSVDQSYGAHTPTLNTEYDYKAVVDATNITYSVTRVSDSVVLATHAYAKSSLYSYTNGSVYFAAGKYDDFGTTASSTITQAQVQ